MFTIIKSFDQSVFWFINSHHNGFFDYFFSLATALGTGWVIAPILLYFVVKAVPNAKRVSFILFSLIVMIASGIINSQLKHYFRTPRPAALFEDRQKAPSNFARIETQPPSVTTVHVVGQRLMQNSFPSGHSNTAFAAATLLALRLGGIFWLAYPAACLVGYSRVYMGAHFPSDVIAGGLLGIIVVWMGFFLFTWVEKRKNNQKIRRSMYI